MTPLTITLFVLSGIALAKPGGLVYGDGTNTTTLLPIQPLNDGWLNKQVWDSTMKTVPVLLDAGLWLDGPSSHQVTQLDPGNYQLISPGFFSNFYRNNFDGGAMFSGTNNQIITTNCTVYIEASTGCIFDKLTITVEPVEPAMWTINVECGPFCGNTTKTNQINGTSLAYRFTTDGSDNAGRWICDIHVPEGCGIANRATKIVNGTTTEVNEYPWQVYLQITTAQGIFACGGSIINTQWVLTAAHCTAGASQITVYAGLHSRGGTPGQEVFSVTDIIDHPQYSFPIYDFALLKLDGPITFKRNIAPVCLPASTSNTYEGAAAIASGWGLTSSPGGSLATVLQELAVTVTAPSPVTGPSPPPCDHPSVICAISPQGAGQGACFGDSGGPLVTLENGRYTLIGVVSFVFGSVCAQGKEDGYGRVTAVLDWIHANTAGTVHGARCP